MPANPPPPYLHQPKQLLYGPAERRQALPKVRRANQNRATTKKQEWHSGAQDPRCSLKHPGLGATATHQQRPTTSSEQTQQAESKSPRRGAAPRAALALEGASWASRGRDMNDQVWFSLGVGLPLEPLKPIVVLCCMLILCWVYQYTATCNVGQGQDDAS